ncbi:MAG: hypothetical protein FJY97_02930 [candidate division Zixibacteria bacterium]|nr:hypothetical protein [candidate division Zixibacteria bacterium]
MKVCILEEDYGLSQAPYGEYNPPSSPEAYFARYAWERYFLTRTNGVRQVMELTRKGFDVVVNLCDGSWGGESPGIEIVETLERLDVPFTGATSAFYEPTRQQMKMVCAFFDIPTPPCRFVLNAEDVDAAAVSLRFPMIVKHPNSYSSIGLTAASRVTTPDALREQARFMMEVYGGALIEEFIDGKEFTVLVAENPDDPQTPIVYRPVEFMFPEGETFKHFNLKWVDFARMGCRRCDDPDLIERLTSMSRRMFTGLNGASYGRCDIRMNTAGELYMLEINPNCGVFYPPEDAGSADFILMNDPGGHAGFVDTILRAALSRHAKRRKKYEVRLHRDGHYGLFATNDIPQGGVVFSFEDHPHTLTHRTGTTHLPGAQHGTWLDRNGFPITDDIWSLWTDDPNDWRPVRHSCAPNAWWEGLSVVTRHPIKSGEEITLDFATFCHESMPAFSCACGASDCRKIVRGTDLFEPFVERYGAHITDYVGQRRQRV